MRSRRLSNVLLLVISLSTLPIITGCSSWHSIGKESLAAYIAREKPRSARLTVLDSTLVVVRPSVRGDSLVGTSAVQGWTVAVPVAKLDKLEVRSARGSTAGKVVVGTFWALGAAMLVTLALFDHPRTNP